MYLSKCFYKICTYFLVIDAFGISDLTKHAKEDYADEISVLEKAVQRNSNSSEENHFLNINVGVDQNNLWYINATIADQQQQLRVDVSQPYVWIINDTEELFLESSSDESYNSEITPFSGNTVYNMLFIDNVKFNSSAFISKMGIENVVNNSYESWENTDIGINTMGFLATNTTSLLGAFGLSGKINNTNWETSQIASNYFNNSFMALEALKDQKTINSAGYSLWLAGNVGEEIDLTKQQTNSSYEIFSNFSVGSLMLNYVNNSLFRGDLVKFESIPYYEVFSQGQSYSSNGYPIFPLSGATLIANNSQSINLSTTNAITPILLDSRYTNCFLPIDIIQQIAIQTNAFYVESVESWYVNCELGDINAQVEFFFGQLPIKVPLKELITDAYLSSENGDNTALYFKSASGKKTAACSLKMKPSYLLGFNILGAPFLKYSYLAADLETNQFALAQAANFAGESLNTFTPIDRIVNSNLEAIDTVVEKAISLTTVSADATNLLRASQSTATASSSSSSSETAMFISSGYIPFAKSSNITVSNLVLTTFSAASTQSKEYGSNILELFGYNFTYGSIFSNGEIVTATKSFYETNLPSYQLTTIAGSTVLASITSSSSSNTNSEILSQYIVTVVFSTQITKVADNTTLYATSPITLYSTHVPNSTVSSYRNNALKPQLYGNDKGLFFCLMQKLGFMGFLWAFV